MKLYIGTFTGGFMGGELSQGLYVFDFDEKTGKSEILEIKTGLISPSYLCRHPILPIIYSAERQISDEDKTQGAISTWKICDDGKLELLKQISSGGAFTAYINVSQNGKILACANPLGPNIATFKIDENGVPSTASIENFSGIGALERQFAPWPHSVYFNKQSNKLYSPDLGLDRITAWDIDAEANISPAKQANIQVSSGAGARHLAIRPDGKFFYLANELDNTISVFKYDETRDALNIVQTIQACDPKFDGANQPAEIIINSKGTHLYITNRGSETIGVFAIDENSGKILGQQFTSNLGNCSRHIAFSPKQDLLFVSNQLSSKVVVFKIENNGNLTPSGFEISVPSPSCVIAI